MTSFKLLFAIVLSLLLASCAAPKELETTVAVLSHSNCENNVATLRFTATGGNKSYIYQLKQKRDGKIVWTEVSSEEELIVELEDLDQLFYEFIVIDDSFVNVEVDFEVRPEGGSRFFDILELEDEGNIYPVMNVPVKLNRVENGYEVVSTTETDESGYFAFEDVPSGLYTISFFISDKFSSYRLSAVQEDNERIRIKGNTQETVPFMVNCRLNLEMDFLYK